MSGSKRWIGSVAAAVALALAAPPAYGSEKQEEDQADVVWMTTIGVVSSGYFFQAHLSIGLLADAREKGLYPKEKCGQLQEVNGQLLDATQKQFSEMLKKGDLSREDAKGIKELGKVNELLRKEVQALAAYWKTGSDGDLQKYTEARQQASKSLTSLGEK